jgi:hypothetical protein
MLTQVQINKIKKLSTLKDYGISQLSHKNKNTKQKKENELKDLLSFIKPEDFDEAKILFIKYQELFLKGEKPKLNNQKPLTKKDLLFIANNPEMIEAQQLAHRTAQVQAKYEQDLKKLPKDKNQLREYILFQNSSYIQYILKINSYRNYNEYFLKINDYPYNLDKNLVHYNIWNFQGKKITKQVIQEVLEKQSKENGEIDFVVYWEWPDSKKSISEFRHCHLIIGYKNKK